MNKTDLIGKLAERLDGDRKAAQVAVEGVIDLIQRTVHGGDTVSISGFGVFEKRARAARTARNPRTGTAVKVKKTVIPAFRPGKYFKDVIAGSVKLPKTVGGAPLTARAAAAAAKTSATRSTAPKAAPATKAAPAEKAAPKTTRAAASKTAATKTPAKAAPAAKAPAAAAAAKATATKTAAKPAAAARTAAPKTAAKATAAPKASAAAAKSPAPKAPARRAAAAKS